MVIILGAMVDDSDKGNESVTDEQVKRFIKNAGKGLGTVYLTDKWAQNPELKFPLQKANICKNNGAVPFIRIQNSEDPDGSPGSAGKYKWKNITDGKFDNQLKKYAVDVKAFGTTVLIELGTEINGKWFSWSDEGTEAFKKGFRYIVKLFRDQGTKNVRFAFHCDATDNPHSKDWYAGDDVTDWVGTSCYGGYGSGKGCIDTLEDCYDNFSSISKKAKLAILEWGAPDPKNIKFNVEDTRKTLELLPKKYPKIKMLQRWAEKIIPKHGEDQIGDGRIDYSPEMLKAYQEGVKNPIYSGKYVDE
jgi:beta-mannanase